MGQKKGAGELREICESPQALTRQKGDGIRQRERERRREDGRGQGRKESRRSIDWRLSVRNDSRSVKLTSTHKPHTASKNPKKKIYTRYTQETFKKRSRKSGRERERDGARGEVRLKQLKRNANKSKFKFEAQNSNSNTNSITKFDKSKCSLTFYGRATCCKCWQTSPLPSTPLSASPCLLFD